MRNKTISAPVAESENAAARIRGPYRRHERLSKIYQLSTRPVSQSGSP